MNKMNSIRIRLARLEDADDIARVHIDTWRTSYIGIIPDEHLANMSYAVGTERWRDILNNAGKSFTFVAETDANEIVAFAGGMPERENDPVYKGELGGIYILKAYQRQGLGRRLVEIVIGRLRQDGFNNMLIWVFAENPATSFYAMLGGKLVRERMVNIGGKDLREIGYGWDDLSVFKTK